MSPEELGKANGILIVGETVDGAPVPLVAEMLALARRLIGSGNGLACVLVLGDASSSATREIVAAGADRVYLTAYNETDLYASDMWLEAVRNVLTRFAPDLVLAGHTSLGAELAPRLAFELNLALATGCEALSKEEDTFVATRPCFGHKAREVISLRSKPAVATVRARSIDPLEPDPGRTGESLVLVLDEMNTSTSPRVSSRTREDTGEGPSLEKANVVVAGGRGLGGPEGFGELERLAECLGGVVGASRVACDLGWCPHSRQIGLTGKTVTPALYIAIGISGASHHMAGCGNAGAILAINSDPEAAIFKEARFGVVGDYREIVPALVRELAHFKSRQATVPMDAP